MPGAIFQTTRRTDALQERASPETPRLDNERFRCNFTGNYSPEGDRAGSTACVENRAVLQTLERGQGFRLRTFVQHGRRRPRMPRMLE